MKQQLKKTLFSVVIAGLVLSSVPTTSTSAAKAKTKIQLNHKKATLTEGKTLKLNVLNSKKKIKWKSSNTKVATISKKGTVKAIKAGKAVITAKVAKKKLKCKITVVKKAVKAKEKAPEASTTMNKVKNSSDVEVLKKIKAKQVGSSISEDLDSNQYVWSDEADSRILEINWRNQKLQGALDLSELSALKKLDASANALTEVTLPAENLVFCNLSDNQLTKLNDWAFKENSKLEFLNLNYNQLKELELLEAPNLKVLKCCCNHLERLTVTSQFLEEISCDYNQLETLDIIAPNYLTKVSCSYNQLEKLTLAGDYIKVLNCSHNQISKLKFDSTALQALICDHNKITELFNYGPNVKNYTALRTLDCSNNKITNLDVRPLTLTTFLCDESVILATDED